MYAIANLRFSFKGDTNVLDGVSLHGAPEFVIANGRVVVFEYEMNPTVNNVGAKILSSEPFPSIFYDQVQDLDELGKVVGVEREISKTEQENSSNAGDETDGPNDANFGLTAERKSSPEVRAVVISEQGEAWKAFVTFFALVFLLHC